MRVEGVEEVLDPQDAEAPQVLQRADAPCTQLKTAGSQSEHSSFAFIWLLAFSGFPNEILVLELG